jgi:hypothetical protein
MKNQPVCEKNAEILFNRFFLQSFPLGSLELFAPFSAEEFKNGYDTKIAGRSAFKEIYLQFKAPMFSEKQDRFTIRTTEHQHNLLKSYPPFSAFYVAPTFRTLKELNEAQTQIETAKEFLRFFVCIEVSCLPQKIKFFHYGHVDSKRGCPDVRYKVPDDGGAKIAKRPIPAKHRILGTQLLSLFKEEQVGHTVALSQGIPKIRQNFDKKLPMMLNEGQSVQKNFVDNEDLAAMNHDFANVFNFSEFCTISEFGVFIREKLR